MKAEESLRKKGISVGDNGYTDSYISSSVWDLNIMQKKMPIQKLHMIERRGKLEEGRGICNNKVKEEIIEYNPEELSYEENWDMDSSNNFHHHNVLMGNNDSHNGVMHYKVSDHDLKVHGKAMPIYGCKNWGKNPYYVVLSKNHKSSMKKSNVFDSLDNQYNWLGIDEKEAKKIARSKSIYERNMNSDVMNSHEDWVKYNDKNQIFIDCFNGKYNDPFIDYNEGNLLNNDTYGKHKMNSSEEIIAIDDTENDMIIPENMQVINYEDRQHEDENMLIPVAFENPDSKNVLI